ncbi:protein AATF [Hylaeus volcanicus]|uniref:protein AATF n=1 Tax=Hylaeus volcanicus TaxID=313075 RepID=UPI0023B8445A|nr:protein AATF [Hylaeus volcanicus]XP_053989507.1 protein AATF [Hylaeus volcanicus]
MALKTKKSLADKINSLITTTPTNFQSDDDAEDTKAKVVDPYEESDNSESNFQVSEIRRRNVDTLDQVDKRYIGRKVSRKDVYVTDDSADDVSEDEEEEMNSTEEEEEEEENDNNVDSNDSNDYSQDDHNNNDDSESYYSDEELSNESFRQSSEDGSNIEDNNPENKNFNTDQRAGFQTISHTNLKADIDKGNCVRSQLKLWESLLEMRIKLQKCLITSNKMPQHDAHEILKDVDYTKKVEETKSNLKLLLNNLLQLQNLFLRQYPETKNLSAQSKKRKAEESIDKEEINEDEDEEIPSDTEDEDEKETSVSRENADEISKNVFIKKLRLDNYEKILNENHKLYTEYRNSVIQKWNEKTRIASGKLDKAMNQTTLKQIEFALSDKEKLRKRTQLKRSEYKIIGKMDAAENENDGRRIQEYDSEIYDDDDFYHQLLRDLIEYRSADITDPIQLSKQWIQLQNMRSKMKRKIDTRATKGRRIRYNVHNKLVNFMAPITINDTWTDHAKDELYNSLFGKIKSTSVEAGR